MQNNAFRYIKEYSKAILTNEEPKWTQIKVFASLQNQWFVAKL